MSSAHAVLVFYDAVLYFSVQLHLGWVGLDADILTEYVCACLVESFKEVQDSLCVAQKSRDGSDERVVLFLKMAPGIQLSTELIRQVQMSIRKELSARHVPAVILQTTDIPVRFISFAARMCVCFRSKVFCVNL